MPVKTSRKLTLAYMSLLLVTLSSEIELNPGLSFLCGSCGIEVNSMQRSGTEAIRTQIQPSKPKLEITNITNSQNIKRAYGQPSEQLSRKRWPLSNRHPLELTETSRQMACHSRGYV